MDTMESPIEKIYKPNKALLVCCGVLLFILGMILFFYWIDQNFFKAIIACFFFMSLSIAFFYKSNSSFSILITENEKIELDESTYFALINSSLTESKAFSQSLFVVKTNLASSHWPFVKKEINRIDLSNIFLN